MQNKKNKIITYKISTICEGEMEEMFIMNLKTHIIRNRILSICKKHKTRFEGGFKKEKLKVDAKCCKTYVIVDKDNKNNKEINNIQEKVNKNHSTLIISIPSVEIIFLSFFESIKKTNWNQKELERKLTEHIGDEYKHSKQIAEKVCNKINKNNNLNLFEQNLEYLDKNKISNFIVLYKKIKGE